MDKAVILRLVAANALLNTIMTFTTNELRKLTNGTCVLRDGHNCIRSEDADVLTCHDCLQERLVSVICDLEIADETTEETEH